MTFFYPPNVIPKGWLKLFCLPSRQGGENPTFTLIRSLGNTYTGTGKWGEEAEGGKGHPKIGGVCIREQPLHPSISRRGFTFAHTLVNALKYGCTPATSVTACAETELWATAVQRRNTAKLLKSRNNPLIGVWPRLQRLPYKRTAKKHPKSKLSCSNSPHRGSRHAKYAGYGAG